MRIAVMGSGAVGCYFGARFAAAGLEVHFIARGKQLEALRARGIELKSANGDLHLSSVLATDDPSTVGPVDFVLFTVKQFDTEPAAHMSKALLGADTAVITVQNGMDEKDRLREILGPDRVMLGAAYIANAAVVAPGVISHAGPLAKLVFGEVDGARSARAERFLAACLDAKIASELASPIQPALWAKFALLAAFSGISTVTRRPIGPIRSEPATRELLAGAIEEVVAVGRSKGVDLGQDFTDEQMTLCDAIPGETKASMLIDLERGNRLELEWMSGAVARMGRETRVPTPIHLVISAALKLYANGSG